MQYLQCLFGLALALAARPVVSSPSISLPNNIQHVPGYTRADHLKAIDQALQSISLGRRDKTFSSNSTTLDTTWQNTILYKHSL
jgi:hypothetical protein